MKKLLAVVVVVAVVAAASVVAYYAGKGSLPWKSTPSRSVSDSAENGPEKTSKRTVATAKKTSFRRVVLVVQNHTSDVQSLPMAAVADSFAANLSAGNLRVINPHNVIGVNQNRTAQGEAMPEASALGLAHMLGADGVITASILEFTGEDIGVPAIAHTLKVRLAVNLADAATGETVCGVQDVAVSRNVTVEKLKADTATEYERLLHEAVAKCSSELLSKYKTCKWEPIEVNMANVSFACNIQGADVMIDGVSMGTAPVQVCVPEGVHNVKVEHPFCDQFNKKSQLSDGQTFNVNLQLDATGRECFRNEQLFKEKLADMRRNRETNAYVTRILAEAKAEYIKRSAETGSSAPEKKNIMSIIDEKLKKIGE